MTEHTMVYHPALTSPIPMPIRVKDYIHAGTAHPRIADIQLAVCRYYRVTLSEMLSEMRVKRITEARQMAIYLSREWGQRSFPVIGRSFNRDHTTAMHAHQKIAAAPDAVAIAAIKRALGW